MKNSNLFKGVYFCQIYEKGNNPNKYYYLFMILISCISLIYFYDLNKKTDVYLKE